MCRYTEVYGYGCTLIFSISYFSLMKTALLFIILALVLFVARLNAQDTIVLNNPSFEDMPRRGMENSPPIKGWHDCGIFKFPGETPPDIHPVPYKAWEVTMPAIEGETY